jgi:hypothetical protein
MPPVNYNFKTKDDLGFYILNAVCHDWIHDFNNYERMGKIVNYIIGLIPDAVTQLNEVNKELVEAETADNARDNNTANSIIATTSTNATSNNNGQVEGDVPVDEEYSLSAGELISSLEDEYLIDASDNLIPQVTSTDIPEQSIVNKSIEAYNTIKKMIHTKGTRSNIIKINILQNIAEFIGESQLLVISKLKSIGFNIGGYTNQRGGAAAINIITTDDISESIYTIIKEIEESDIPVGDKKNLTNIFNLMNQVFINFDIPGISPLEKFNTSLISEIISMFIVNNCETNNIEKEAILYLNCLGVIKEEKTKIDVAKGIKIDPTKSFNDDPTSVANSYGYDEPSYTASYIGGGYFKPSTYTTTNKELWQPLNNTIDEIKNTILYENYIGAIKINETNYQTAYKIYEKFITDNKENTIKLIVGSQQYKNQTIMIKNLFRIAEKNNNRNYIKNVQKLVDTINKFIFDEIINPYEDIKNVANSRQEGLQGKVTGEALVAVQKISQLVAKKTLELTGYNNYNKNYDSNTSNNDLITQINIIKDVANDNQKAYTTVDNKLLTYFNTYIGKPNFKHGSDATQFLTNKGKSCTNSTCRAINNAIPTEGCSVKGAFENVIVCPTSSVCDGMGNFGSCIPPKNKEYYNMDFQISFLNGGQYFYQGSTNIKDKRSVNINYGFSFGGLQLYNFLEIDLTEKPIILQANYTFKGVINRIIDIWKTAKNINNSTGLWGILENTDYFLSILKLGSQKAVGDIFQEINSTLDNGGYSVPVYFQNVQKTTLNNMQTFGLMGDRPSGIRVIKLLKDADAGVNKKACGGYIGKDASNTTLIYNNITTQGGGKTKKNKRNKKNKKSKKQKKNIQNKTKKKKKNAKNKKSIKI